jgi:N,N'-diacetylbacillosaminyl-diphospho-undecaprenol alpha-1,3-N-acetylgalactosaminyltransferase
MRAALICPDDLSIVLFCKGIIDELKGRGAQVFVLSDIFNGQGERSYFKEVQSWQVEHIPLKIERSFKLGADVSFFLALYGTIRRKRLDVIINISTKPNVFGTIAGRLAGVQKILCSVWGRGSVFVEEKGMKNRLRKYCLLALNLIAYRLSTRVWFTNRNDFNYFLQRRIVSKAKTILTKNYVSAEEYFPYQIPEEKLINYRREFGLRETDRVVVMVARMIWPKGVREFAEAAAIIKETMPEVKFILVGPEERNMGGAVPLSYLEEKNRTGNFLWVGFRDDVKDLYALADIAVLPSYYKEGGYPRGLTEPMAMGKPVIATDSADCRGPVEDGKNGYLVPIKDARALSDAISVLMKDDKKREEFGKYSRQRVEREFDERIIVQQVIDEFLGPK